MLINAKFDLKKRNKKKIRKNILNKMIINYKYNKLNNWSKNKTLNNYNKYLEELKFNNTKIDNEEIKKQVYNLNDYIIKNEDILDTNSIIIIFDIFILLLNSFNNFDKEFEFLKFSFLLNLKDYIIISKYYKYELLLNFNYLNYNNIDKINFKQLLAFNIYYFYDFNFFNNTLNENLFSNINFNLISWGFNNLNIIENDENLYKNYKKYIEFLIINNKFNTKWINFILNLFEKNKYDLKIIDIIISLELNKYFYINFDLFKDIFNIIIESKSQDSLKYFWKLYLIKILNIKENQFILDNDYINFIKDILLNSNNCILIKIIIKIINNLFYEKQYILNKDLIFKLFKLYLIKKDNKKDKLKINILHLLISYFDYNLYKYIYEYIDIIQYELIFDLKHEINQNWLKNILIFINLILELELNDNGFILNRVNLESIKYFLDFKNIHYFKDDLIYEFLI